MEIRELRMDCEGNDGRARERGDVELGGMEKDQEKERGREREGGKQVREDERGMKREGEERKGRWGWR